MNAHHAPLIRYGLGVGGTETERSRRSARVEAIEERKRMAVALLNPGSVSRASGVVVD